MTTEAAPAETTAAAAVAEPVAEESKPEEESKPPHFDLAANNPKAWLTTLNGASVRKLGYVVLEWVSGTIGKEGGSLPFKPSSYPPLPSHRRSPLPAQIPGGETKEVTGSEFVNYLKDGTILANLANKMEPNAIPEVRLSFPARPHHLHTLRSPLSGPRGRGSDGGAEAVQPGVLQGLREGEGRPRRLRPLQDGQGTSSTLAFPSRLFFVGAMWCLSFPRVSS